MHFSMHLFVSKKYKKSSRKFIKQYLQIENVSRTMNDYNFNTKKRTNCKQIYIIKRRLRFLHSTSTLPITKRYLHQTRCLPRICCLSRHQVVAVVVAVDDAVAVHDECGHDCCYYYVQLVATLCAELHSQVGVG
eukprot:m.97154 g.97154  ORF g.97154 m.97154 type:complete len:134 (-) comp8982_c0_seq1:11069-11470(-)